MVKLLRNKIEKPKYYLIQLINFLKNTSYNDADKKGSKH